MEVLVEGPSRTDPDRLRGRTRHNKAVNFTGLASPGELTQVAHRNRIQPDALGGGESAGASWRLRGQATEPGYAADHAR